MFPVKQSHALHPFSFLFFIFVFFFCRFPSPPPSFSPSCSFALYARDKKVRGRGGACKRATNRENTKARGPPSLSSSHFLVLSRTISPSLLHPPPRAPSLHLSLCFYIPLPLCLSIFVSLAHSRACALQYVCHGIYNL